MSASFRSRTRSNIRLLCLVLTRCNLCGFCGSLLGLRSEGCEETLASLPLLLEEMPVILPFFLEKMLVILPLLLEEMLMSLPLFLEIRRRLVECPIHHVDGFFNLSTSHDQHGILTDLGRRRSEGTRRKCTILPPGRG